MPWSVASHAEWGAASGRARMPYSAAMLQTGEAGARQAQAADWPHTDRHSHTEWHALFDHLMSHVSLSLVVMHLSLQARLPWQQNDACILLLDVGQPASEGTDKEVCHPSSAPGPPPSRAPSPAASPAGSPALPRMFDLCGRPSACVSLAGQATKGMQWAIQSLLLTARTGPCRRPGRVLTAAVDCRRHFRCRCRA